ncbi:hypothetical protein EGW08_019275, partial [Elysia chlorotica]
MTSRRKPCLIVWNHTQLQLKTRKQTLSIHNTSARTYARLNHNPLVSHAHSALHRTKREHSLVSAVGIMVWRHNKQLRRAISSSALLHGRQDQRALNSLQGLTFFSRQHRLVSEGLTFFSRQHRLVSEVGQSSRASGPGVQRVEARAVSMVRPSEFQLQAVGPDNILRNPLPDIHIPPGLSLHQMVFDICDQFKDNLAVEEHLTGRSYTFSQLKEAIVRVASALSSRGYRKGDVLLVFAINNVDYNVLSIACAAAGVWITPANPAFTAEELSRQLHHSEAKGLCISAPLAAIAKDAVASQEFPSNVKHLMVFGEASGFEPFQSLLDDDGKSFPDVDIDPVKDVFALPYSSGTTGFPKGVMLSHHNVVANAHQTTKIMSPEPHDVCMGLPPMYHIYGLSVVQFVSWMNGASISLLPKFEPEMFLRYLQDRRISVAYLVPPLVLFLAKHPLVPKFDLSSITEVFCGAAPLGEELTRTFLEKFPNVEFVRQGYGLTETSPMTNLDATKTMGSVGHMLVNTRGKIVDPDTGHTLPSGQPGEVWVKGPQVMLGYHNNQAATDGMITQDQWLRTGDVGYFNDDGLVFIKDRLKEIIKYKGSQ